MLGIPLFWKIHCNCCLPYNSLNIEFMCEYGFMYMCVCVCENINALKIIVKIHILLVYRLHVVILAIEKIANLWFCTNILFFCRLQHSSSSYLFPYSSNQSVFFYFARKEWELLRQCGEIYNRMYIKKIWCDDNNNVINIKRLILLFILLSVSLWIVVVVVVYTVLDFSFLTRLFVRFSSVQTCYSIWSCLRLCECAYFLFISSRFCICCLFSVSLSLTLLHTHFPLPHSLSLPPFALNIFLMLFSFPHFILIFTSILYFVMHTHTASVKRAMHFCSVVRLLFALLPWLKF